MPPGVPYIIGNEAAERFAYYGMNSVLTVFMAQIHGEPIRRLAGNAGNEAQGWFNQFVLSVYWMPFFGALIADGWRANTIDLLPVDRLLPRTVHAGINGYAVRSSFWTEMGSSNWADSGCRGCRRN